MVGEAFGLPLPGGGVSSFDDLSDVDMTTTPPSNGQVPVFAGGMWVPGTVTGGGGGWSLLHVQHQLPSGTGGGTSVAGSWQTRPLNTVVTNGITGASLLSNRMVLPAGTYEAEGYTFAYRPGTFQARLYDVTNSTVLALGVILWSNNASTYAGLEARAFGRFTLAATANVELQYRVSASLAGAGLGFAAGWGTEVYAEAQVRKLA